MSKNDKKRRIIIEIIGGFNLQIAYSTGYTAGL